MNPFACLQKFKYMRPEFMACPRQKLSENLKLKQCKKDPEPNSQISMEQLLQNFSARLNAPYSKPEAR